MTCSPTPPRWGNASSSWPSWTQRPPTTSQPLSTRQTFWRRSPNVCWVCVSMSVCASKYYFLVCLLVCLLRGGAGERIFFQSKQQGSVYHSCFEGRVGEEGLCVCNKCASLKTRMTLERVRCMHLDFIPPLLQYFACRTMTFWDQSRVWLFTWLKLYFLPSLYYCPATNYNKKPEMFHFVFGFACWRKKQYGK